jgi:non-canonical purine NTP pyrophosphatase (RdgB/HAM1 family)
VNTGWLFVTSNENKWREAQLILGRSLDRITLDLPEIQAATTMEVALEKAKVAFALLKRPVIIEDAGLELTALKGFPGPFIKFWEKLGGLESICRAVDGLADRRATAVCALVAYDAKGPQPFEGRAEGTIAPAPKGKNGFGWDAVFIPEGESRTWAEVTQAEKDARSHRRRAWQLLASKLIG